MGGGGVAAAEAAIVDTSAREVVEPRAAVNGNENPADVAGQLRRRSVHFRRDRRSTSPSARIARTANATSSTLL